MPRVKTEALGHVAAKTEEQREENSFFVLIGFS